MKKGGPPFYVPFRNSGSLRVRILSLVMLVDGLVHHNHDMEGWSTNGLSMVSLQALAYMLIIRERGPGSASFLMKRAFDSLAFAGT